MCSCSSSLSLILFVVLAFLFNTNYCAAALLLRFQRVHSPFNTVRLSCLQNTILVINATFYLNNRVLNSLNYPTFTNTSSQNDSVNFIINQNLEGFYSCGIGSQRSDTVPLIGKVVET